MKVKYKEGDRFLTVYGNHIEYIGSNYFLNHSSYTMFYSEILPKGAVRLFGPEMTNTMKILNAMEKI